MTFCLSALELLRLSLTATQISFWKQMQLLYEENADWTTFSQDAKLLHLQVEPVRFCMLKKQQNSSGHYRSSENDAEKATL